MTETVHLPTAQVRTTIVPSIPHADRKSPDLGTDRTPVTGSPILKVRQAINHELDTPEMLAACSASLWQVVQQIHNADVCPDAALEAKLHRLAYRIGDIMEDLTRLGEHIETGSH